MLFATGLVSFTPLGSVRDQTTEGATANGDNEAENNVRRHASTSAGEYNGIMYHSTSAAWARSDDKATDDAVDAAGARKAKRKNVGVSMPHNGQEQAAAGMSTAVVPTLAVVVKPPADRENSCHPAKMSSPVVITPVTNCKLHIHTTATRSTTKQKSTAPNSNRIRAPGPARGHHERQTYR